MITAKSAQKELRKFASVDYSKKSQRFFKTGPGEYSKGDVFIGVHSLVTRNTAGSFSDLTLIEVGELLVSNLHEDRFLTLVILIIKYSKSKSGKDKKVLDGFIKKYGKKMPCTMLRYSIKRYPELERKRILSDTKSV